MRIDTKQRFLLILIVLILISSASIFIPLKRSITFINNETESLAAYSLLTQPRFQIKYTHSIHLSEVIESFEVLPDNTLKMTELEYEDFNIGMPSNAGEGEVFVEKDGKYFIKNMDRRIPEFSILIGDVDAGLSLIKDGKEYDLKKTLARGKTYTFRIQRLSFFQQLKGVNIDDQ
ncbi:DUF1850 domain-containing protein [Planomicrobium sp. Y74]|uniref:DUF1850 domain-containing protein n=1 Tax=Planomicrobium sp. Y74 TaxID=2478977 RepID=UPI000EF4C684|nr:DUF1850 domain-containing protein [Planomicrobium sp. Y74]RLQ92951.1 DUF1850 domain-containing protein [Planomicrobium sp. Y74]